MTPGLMRQARESCLGEMNDHIVYRTLADQVRDPRLRSRLEQIAAMELRHAGFWRRLLAGGLIATLSAIDLRRKVLEMLAAGLGAAGLA
ncbi:MAG: hypothetical protein D6786_03110 [Gammaproteobacteria bacterium]|nr:MAG: hypothetical protein D6786_03110 [Gammaproteobacteria bacterium]